MPGLEQDDERRTAGLPCQPCGEQPPARGDAWYLLDLDDGNEQRGSCSGHVAYQISRILPAEAERVTVRLAGRVRDEEYEQRISDEQAAQLAARERDAAARAAAEAAYAKAYREAGGTEDVFTEEDE